jgi:hypothetical protein
VRSLVDGSVPLWARNLNKLFLRPVSNLDFDELALAMAAPAIDAGRSDIPRLALAASRIISPLFVFSAGLALAGVAWSMVSKRQS